MWLFFGENLDKFFEIGDTSASKKLEKFSVAVTWLYNIDNVLSLLPRDASDITKFVDKSNVGIDTVHQVNATDREPAHPNFVKRTNVSILSADI